MTAADATPSGKRDNGAREDGPTAANERVQTRPPRRSTELRLPRGVLVRVDVFQDEHGRFQAFTRERLTGRWGDERSEVATLVVQTGLDILNRFADEEETRPGPPVALPGEATRIGSRNPIPNPDLQRLYA